MIYCAKSYSSHLALSGHQMEHHLLWNVWCLSHDMDQPILSIHVSVQKIFLVTHSDLDREILEEADIIPIYSGRKHISGKSIDMEAKIP